MPNEFVDSNCLYSNKHWLLKSLLARVIITLAVADHIASANYGPLVKRPKTPPSHGGNRGSNPLWVTKKKIIHLGLSFLFLG